MMTGLKPGRSATQPTRASVPLTRRQFCLLYTSNIADTLMLGVLWITLQDAQHQRVGDVHGGDGQPREVPGEHRQDQHPHGHQHLSLIHI